MVIHNDQELFQCGQCNQSFLQKKLLKKNVSPVLVVPTEAPVDESIIGGDAIEENKDNDVQSNIVLFLAEDQVEEVKESKRGDLVMSMMIDRMMWKLLLMESTGPGRFRRILISQTSIGFSLPCMC